MLSDLLGKRVKVIESEGRGGNYKVTGWHAGTVRVIYMKEGDYQLPKFMIEEEGRLVVRTADELRIPKQGEVISDGQSH